MPSIQEGDPAGRDDPVTLRCEFAAAEVPEFGGAYLESHESASAPVLYVWLTDAEAVTAVLEPLRDRCPEHGDVIIRHADYSYRQLSEWQHVASTLVDVTVSAVDTRTNRLTVGVADLAADGEDVSDQLAGRGVPVEAVTLVEVDGPLEVWVKDPTSHHLLFSLIALAAGLVLLAVAVPLWWHRHRRRAARASLPC